MLDDLLSAGIAKISMGSAGNTLPSAALQSPALQDARSFHDALVSHGLVIPSHVPGLFGYSARFEQVLDAINNLITRVSFEDGAELMSFPPIIDRHVVERSGYAELFPGRCGAISALSSTPAATPDKPSDSLTQLALSPSACFPLYPTMTGTLPEGGRLITMMNWVFRHAPSVGPMSMLSFRVREFVRLGERQEVVSWRDMWLQRGVELLSSLGLEATCALDDKEPSGLDGWSHVRGTAEQPQKHELCASMGGELPPAALASLKLHYQHFGSLFNILTARGAIAHTACMGVGLARMTLALFHRHGFDVEAWPGGVRERLWP
jgi:seryl-tRNA synthetase